MNVPDSTLSFADSIRGSDRDVHLWRISLCVGPAEIPRLRSTLSSDEQIRAARFATDGLTRRFVVCRAATRSILAGYTGQDAGQLEFRHGRYGKPALTGPDAKALVRFNVSHSADLAVLAVAWQREIGVDVEAIKQIMHVDRMVQRCLSPAEQRVFQNNEEAHRTKLFLTYWTHKEAYLKAIGMGLQIPLSAIEFDLHKHGQSRIMRLPDGQEGETGDFQVIQLGLGDGYRRALVAQGAGPVEVRYTDWRGIQ